MVTSFCTSPLHTTSQVSRTSCETLDIPDRSSVVDVISEHLLCIFKAILSNLRRIGVLLSKHVPRAEVPTHVKCRTGDEGKFRVQYRCFHENTNGNVNTGTSDLHSRQEHMWWQVHSFDNTNVVTKPRSRDITGELESFLLWTSRGNIFHMLMIFASWMNITDAMKRRITRELNHREQDSTSQNFRKLLRSLQTNCGVQPGLAQSK